MKNVFVQYTKTPMNNNRESHQSLSLSERWIAIVIINPNMETVFLQTSALVPKLTFFKPF